MAARLSSMAVLRRTPVTPYFEAESLSFFPTARIARKPLKPMLLSPLDSIQITKGALR